MNIWIINPYGNIPGEEWRTYRTSLIAEALVARGHRVVSWISNIQHRSKQKRSEDWKIIQVYPGYEIRIVPSSMYRDHISLDRIRYERRYARNMRKMAETIQERPDVIILGDPALFIADIILPMVRQKGAALIVDVIDLWPELFHMVLPRSLQGLGSLIFAPLYARRKKLYRQARGLMAVAADYLRMARKANPDVPSRLVYLGMDLREFDLPEETDYQNLNLMTLRKQPGEIWMIYAGTLGENYDIRSLLRVAVRLQQAGDLHHKLLIAGDGPLKTLVEETIRRQELTHTIYLGSLSPQDLVVLYRQCDLAISGYVRQSTVAMPVKAYDYLAAGLPMVNSLGRDLGELVSRREVGIQYRPEDPEDLYRAIRQLSDDPALRRYQSRQARQLALEFDLQVQYPKVADLVEEITGPLRMLTPADAPAIASLHIQRFPGFFLTGLGRPFLRRFYELLLMHPEGWGQGYFEEGRLVGFAVGSRRAGGFYRELLSRGWWGLGLRAFPRLLARPGRLLHLWHSFRASDPDPSLDDHAVLLSIAVSRAAAAKGVGSQLLTAAEALLIKSGSRGLSLTTDREDNLKANQFYIKNNYIFVKSFMQARRPMNVYFKSFEA